MVSLVSDVPEDVLQPVFQELFGNTGTTPPDRDRYIYHAEQAAARHGALDGIPALLVLVDRIAHRLGGYRGLELHRWINNVAGGLSVSDEDLRDLCRLTGRALGDQSMPQQAEPVPGPRPDPENPPAPEPARPTYSGLAKVRLCQRLGDQWQDLADLVGVPRHERVAFAHGREPQGVWEWLEDRGRLGELPAALLVLEREDLIRLLSP